MKRTLVLAFAVVACSNDPPPQPETNACTLDFSGNLSTQASATGCASVTETDAGTTVFAIDATSAQTGQVALSIALPGAITTGTLSSEVIQDWGATITGFADAGCSFTAGADDVPSGSFTLTIDSISPKGAPHGDVMLEAVVHAPPSTDCGPTDLETIHVRF